MGGCDGSSASGAGPCPRAAPSMLLKQEGAPLSPCPPIPCRAPVGRMQLEAQNPELQSSGQPPRHRAGWRAGGGSAGSDQHPSPPDFVTLDLRTEQCCVLYPLRCYPGTVERGTQGPLSVPRLQHFPQLWLSCLALPDAPVAVLPWTHFLSSSWLWLIL